MNLLDLVIIGIIAITLILAGKKIIEDRLNGKTGCGCGADCARCNGCPGQNNSMDTNICKRK